MVNGSEELFSVEPLAPQSSARHLGSSNNSNILIIDEIGVSRLPPRSENREMMDDGNDADNMIVDNDDDNNSEQDETAIDRDMTLTQAVRQATLNEINEPGESNDQMNDLHHEQIEESDPELDLLAETDSDSDDNHSNQDAASAQRSVQTGATAGSDTDDSAESSQQEDEESEAGETDEQESEDYPLNNDQLERRTHSGNGQRSSLTPQNMQWAIRSREGARSQSIRINSGSSMVFLDPGSLRRSATSSGSTSNEQVTMATTASFLARAFGKIFSKTYVTLFKTLKI